MPKLHQVIALVSGKKKTAADAVTAAYHAIQKSAQFDGISRSYQPRDELGEKLPPETKHIQTRVTDLTNAARAGWTEMFDAVATQEYANTRAMGSVVVDGVTVLKDVPVTYLMFLEKQITDVITFLGKLPTLDPADEWRYDSATDAHATPPTETTRTKKVPKNHVKAEATKEHPAQVEMYHEDVIVGTWKTIKYSGAMPAKRRNELLDRARKLKEAVTTAREQANTVDAPAVHVGKPLFDFLLA